MAATLFVVLVIGRKNGSNASAQPLFAWKPRKADSFLSQLESTEQAATKVSWGEDFRDRKEIQKQRSKQKAWVLLVEKSLLVQIV